MGKSATLWVAISCAQAIAVALIIGAYVEVWGLAKEVSFYPWIGLQIMFVTALWTILRSFKRRLRNMKVEQRQLNYYNKG